MIRLNLGCGTKYLKGYINTDIRRFVKADKYFDLEKFPYPFKDNFAEEILMDNVLEHLENITLVMEELHRILKQGGKLKLYLPYFKSDGAFWDPTHTHFFTEKSMDYFIDGSEHSYYSKARFKLLKKFPYNANKTRLSKFRVLIPFKNFLKYFLFNIYDGLYFELEAIK